MKLKIIRAAMLSRACTFDILEGAQEFPIVGLLGSRQTGKTTLAQLIFKEHAYVSLKDIELRAAATIDPGTFLNAVSNRSGLIIDDFQYVPELLSYLQKLKGTHTKGRYIVCGPHSSSNKELLGHLEEQVAVHSLVPLSLRELSENYLLPEHLPTLLYTGLYPASYIQDEDPQAIYRQLLSEYIDRDVCLEGQVDNVTTFHTFLVQCATQVGLALNITTLAAASGISDHTAKRWLALLEEHQLIFSVKPYHTSYGKRVIKSSKIYFYDTGLLCCLLKLSKGSVDTSPYYPKLFESLIMSELKKWTLHLKKGELYFWKDKTEYEIDCLLEINKRAIPIQIQTMRERNTNALNLAYWHKIAQSNEKGWMVSDSTSIEGSSDESTTISWQYLHPLFKKIQTR